MSDVFTEEKRSDVMSRIRSSGTRPEEAMHRLLLEVLDRRWRIDRNVADLPGKPDFVIPSLSLAIFIDGCFFHACPRHGRIPDSNTEYWRHKIEGNVARDLRNRRKLRRLGYAVWRLWEHDLKTKAALASTHDRLAQRIAARRQQLCG